MLSFIIITKKTYKNQIEAIVKGLDKANTLLNNNPDESAKIVSKYIGLTIDEQKLCTSRLNWQLGWEQNDVQSLEQTAKTLFELKKINTIPIIKNYTIGK